MESAPSLRPWKWGEGITSTNELIDNTITGTCAFFEVDLSRVIDEGKELVGGRSKNIAWECTA
jgi:hypothetical protein